MTKFGQISPKRFKGYKKNYCIYLNNFLVLVVNNNNVQSDPDSVRNFKLQEN